MNARGTAKSPVRKAEIRNGVLGSTSTESCPPRMLETKLPRSPIVVMSPIVDARSSVFVKYVRLKRLKVRGLEELEGLGTEIDQKSRKAHHKNIALERQE